jgi:hypothetical protein
MVLSDFLFVFVLALVLTAVLTLVLGRRGPGPGAGFLFFFALLMLLIWAGGVWMAPRTSPWRGAYWLTFIAVGLVITLLLAATVPRHRPPKTTAESQRQGQLEETQRAILLAFGAFFWILLAALIVAIVGRYLMTG